MDDQRPTTEQWPTIAQFATSGEGEVAVSALSAADIPSKLVVDHTEEPAPQGLHPNIDQSTSGVQLRVPEDRVEEAVALLAGGDDATA